MRLVCISDTHGRHGELSLPEGDFLLHAGDFTSHGELAEIAMFNAWLGTLPHRRKVVIAGNHDFALERLPEIARPMLTHAIYLEDEEVSLDGLRIYGSPWQPLFFNWAFNLERGEPLKRKWERIPAGIDVLLTHGPPQGILDLTSRGSPVGCADLLSAVARVKPRLHLFGHIHEAYGQQTRGGVTYVNASSCDLRYRPVQEPIVIELE